MFNRVFASRVIAKRFFGLKVLRSEQGSHCTTSKILSASSSNSGYFTTECKYSTFNAAPEATDNPERLDVDIRNLTLEELEKRLESDPERLKRYKVLQLEIDVMRQMRSTVPESIKPDHWIQLLELKTRTARRRYLHFIFTTEMKKKGFKLKKEQARLIREKERETEPESEGLYGLHKNTFLLRIYDTTMHRHYNGRLMQAMQFGPKLIIDCSYHETMTRVENTECGKQLSYVFAENRVHPEPFDIHLCNVNKTSSMMQRLHKIIPTIYEDAFPLNITEKSYLDMFPKSDLVYLTPHCNNELENYDPEAVYIVGAMVDKSNSAPLSLAKAKKEGLKMAKLPFDKYLPWGSGASKRLPLNQMVRILLDLRRTGDWHKALEHIPRRKLYFKSHGTSVTNDATETKATHHSKNFTSHNERPRKSFQEESRAAFSFEARKKIQRFK